MPSAGYYDFMGGSKDVNLNELDNLLNPKKSQTSFSEEPFMGVRDPRLGAKMESGDIYAEGGNMAPSYTVSPYSTQGTAQDILKNTGFLDAMMQKEEQIRKQRLQQIKDITGVKEIQGEEKVMFPANPEMAKKFESLPDSEKMMIQEVASGKMRPEEYRQKKEEQDKQLLAAMQVIVSQQTKDRHILTKEGREIPKTAEGYRGAMTPGTGVAIEGEGPFPQGRSGGGGRSGSSGGEEYNIETQTNVLVQERNTLLAERSKIGGTNPTTGAKIPFNKDTKAQYQTYVQKIAALDLAEAILPELKDTMKAKKKAQDFLNMDVAEVPNGPLIVTGYDAKNNMYNRLNMSSPKVMALMQEGIRAGWNAERVYNFLIAEMVKNNSIISVPGQAGPRYMGPE